MINNNISGSSGSYGSSSNQDEVNGWSDQRSQSMPDLGHKKFNESKAPNPFDNSQLPLYNLNFGPGKQPITPNGASNVFIHAKGTVTAVQPPGLIARTRTSCLSFLQRCFGRAAR